MLNRTQIEHFTVTAAQTAYHILGLDCGYSIELIEDPNTNDDGRMDMLDNVVMLNLAVLKPHRLYDDSDESVERLLSEFAAANGLTPEQKDLCQENFDHALYVQFVVYHEMRHLYQVEVLRNYMFNSFFGEDSEPQPESDRTCERWLREMRNYEEDEPRSNCSNSTNSPAVEQPTLDIEADADAFAIYLLQRTYSANRGSTTNRRIAKMKRRYDRIPLPQDLLQENAPNQVGTMDDHCA